MGGGSPPPIINDSLFFQDSKKMSIGFLWCLRQTHEYFVLRFFAVFGVFSMKKWLVKQYF
jgi:hypothetical protein